MVRAYVATAAHAPLPPEVIDATVAPWCGEMGQPAFYRRVAQADQRYTDAVQSHYAEVEPPVLVLWGQEDTWIPADRAYTLRVTVGPDG